MSNFKIGNCNVPKRRKSRLGKRLSENASNVLGTSEIPGPSRSHYWKTPRSLGKSKYQTVDGLSENEEPRDLNAVKKCLFKKPCKETLDITATRGFEPSTHTPCAAKIPVHISGSQQVDHSNHWRSVEETSCSSGVSGSSNRKSQYSALVSSQFADQSMTKHRRIMPSLLKSKYNTIESPKTPLSARFRMQPQIIMSPVEPICNWQTTTRKVSSKSEPCIVPRIRADGKSLTSDLELVTNPAVSSTQLPVMGPAKHQSPDILFNDSVANFNDSDSSFVCNESALLSPSCFVKSEKKLSTIAEEHVDRYSESRENMTKTVNGTCSVVSLPNKFENVLNNVPKLKASSNVSLIEPLTDKNNLVNVEGNSELVDLVKKDAVSISEENQSELNRLVSSDKDKVKLILLNIQSKTTAYIKYVDESEAEMKQNIANITNILKDRRSKAEVYKRYADENMRQILDIVNVSVPKSDSTASNFVPEGNPCSNDEINVSKIKSCECKEGAQLTDTVKSVANSKLSARNKTPRRSERLLLNQSAVNMYSNLKLAYNLKTPETVRKNSKESSQQSPWSLARRVKNQMKNLFDD